MLSADELKRAYDKQKEKMRKAKEAEDRRYEKQRREYEEERIKNKKEGISIEHVNLRLKECLKRNKDIEGYTTIWNKIEDRAIQELKKNSYRIFIVPCVHDERHPYRTVLKTFILGETLDDYIEETLRKCVSNHDGVKEA